MAGLSEESYNHDIAEAIKIVNEHNKEIDRENAKSRLEKMRDNILRRLSISQESYDEDKYIYTIISFINDGDGFTIKLPDGTAIGHISLSKNVKAKIIKFNPPEYFKKEIALDKSNHPVFKLYRGIREVSKFDFETKSLTNKTTGSAEFDKVKEFYHESNNYLAGAENIYNMITKKEYNTLNSDFITYSLEQMVKENTTGIPSLVDNDKMQVYTSVQAKLRQIMSILASPPEDLKKVDYQLEYLYKEICTELINAGFTELRNEDVLKNNH